MTDRSSIGAIAVTSAALVIALAGCGTADHGQLAEAMVDTLPGGVVRVTSAGPTAWSGTGSWRFVEERTIAPAEGSPGEIGDPDGVAIADDGTVYLIQRKPNAIKVYAPDGTFLRDISREGEGPGEFRMGYIGVRGDTVALQDPALHRFTTFLSDGTLLQSRSSPGDWISSYLDIDRHGIAAVPGGITIGDDHHGAMIRTGMNGTVIDTIIVPEDGRPRKMWRASWNTDRRRYDMRMPAPLQPSTHERYHADGFLVHGTTDRPELILSRTGRDTAMIIRTTIPPVPVTAAQGDSLFQANLDAMEWQAEWLVEGSRADVPEFWPSWLTFSVDRTGHIWLGIPGPKGGIEAAQVFDRTGSMLGTVPIPHRGILSGTWGGDRVAVLDESEEGYPVVRIFRLVKGE